MEVLANASILALVSMFVGLLPLATAIVYAIWPNEPRLTLVRTLSLATVFASVSGTTLGFISVLKHIGEHQAEFTPVAAIGLAEALVAVFFGFGCLTVTWLCVTIGLWRRTEPRVMPASAE